MIHLVIKNPLIIYFRENEVTLPIGTPVMVTSNGKKFGFCGMSWEDKNGELLRAEITSADCEINLCTEAELRKINITKILK